MTSKEFTEYRNWVINQYLLDNGNRLSTLINLVVEDLNFPEFTIKMRHAKNRRQQYIGMSYDLAQILKEYILIAGHTSGKDFFFCDKNGNQIKARRLQESLAEYNKSRGVARTGIHRYRHTFAKKFLQDGGDPFVLKDILGQQTMEMVNKYVRYYASDLVESIQKHSPLSTMREQLGLKKRRIITG